MLLTAIFYHVDDFCKEIKKHLVERNRTKHVGRPASMSTSEILTIIIYYHHSKAKTFKDYYKIYILGIYRSAFYKPVSYNRFVELIGENLCFIAMFSLAQNASATGIGFIDSTPISVCHNRRIHSHKTLKGIAMRGKSSMGWFFGFKLHFVINHIGEITGFTITPGNVDDRNLSVIKQMTKNLFGKLFGDRGYISRNLFEWLFEKGIQIITRLKKDMNNKLMSLMDKILLRKRGLIESVGNILKNVLNLEHSRHRSVKGFFSNIFSCIAAYAFHTTKPSLNINKNDLICAATE